MKLHLTCPSKTFLLGEYLVLNEGSALLAATEPRFTLSVDTRGRGTVQGIHPESPAGQWIRQNRLQFEGVDVEFIDEHAGRGGLGASSAQYLLVHLLTQVLKNPDKKSNFQLEPIWRAYRQLETVSGEGIRPSGADLAAQFTGGLCEVQLEPFQTRRIQWPFPEFDVILARTGKKVTTHEHLRGLKRVNTEELGWIYSRAIETLSVRDPFAFFDSVNDYYAELLELGLVAEHTQVLATSLLTHPFVKAAKGCGALGADMIAVFHAKDSAENVRGLLREMDLEIAGTLDGLSSGYELVFSPSKTLTRLPPAKIESGP